MQVPWDQLLRDSSDRFGGNNTKKPVTYLEGKSLCREIRRAKLQSLLYDISTTIASFWSTNTELVNPFEWPKMRTIVHANFKFIEIPLGISHNLSGEKFGFGQIDNVISKSTQLLYLHLFKEKKYCH
jgi:hypothetical protein